MDNYEKMEDTISRIESMYVDSGTMSFRDALRRVYFAAESHGWKEGHNAGIVTGEIRLAAKIEGLIGGE